ncbi:MAG: imidazolonepropionase [Tenericutes bacterium]|jgi:imidazolonepropionase|nr:imidazolonepropionase [Mycoplasmatota bacterium]
MKTIIHNIKTIYTSKLKPPVKGKDMASIETIDQPYLVIEDGIIQVIDKGNYHKHLDSDTEIYDAKQSIMIPGLIDSHTHLVFGGSREFEFSQKIAGVPYLDILAAGGGILNTVNATKYASFDELYEQAKKSLDEMFLFGVTSLEVKSGYGLDLETEMKQLKVAKLLNENHPIDIYMTYLGAHALPKEYKDKRDKYIDQVIEDLNVIHQEKLADYVDVFCETGVFTAKETKKILTAAKKLGFKLRVHSDEIESIGGTKVSINLEAKTVDHLMAITESDMELLAKSNTIGNLLPSTSFFLNKEYAPARKMIEKGMALAVSSDYNPGSTPSENYQLTLQIAGNKLRMLPTEILTASTINPAYSLDIDEFVGSIEVGKSADLLLLDCPNLDYFIYHYGINHTHSVFKKGKLFIENRKVVDE